MKKLLLYGLVFLFTFSCVPDDGPDPIDDGPDPITIEEGSTDNDSQNNDADTDSPTTNTISGKVVLPDASGINSDDLVVESYKGNSTLEGGTYTIEIEENTHNLLFVMDSSDKVVLLGYNYPGQSDYEINAKSTTLALLMSLPFMSMLNDEAKTGFINHLLTDPGFTESVDEMEKMVESGISPLATDQEKFMEHLLQVFSGTLADKQNKMDEDDIVNVIRQGKEINFINPGKSYDVEIGVYKDTKKVETLELDRVLFVATSASEAAEAVTKQVFDEISIEQDKYEIKEDGEYEIKIRNGFAFDGTSEDIRALVDNLAKVAFDIYLAIPFAKNTEIKCNQEILNVLKNTASAVSGSKDDFDSVPELMFKAYGLLKTAYEGFKFIDCLDFSTRKAVGLEKLLTWLHWVSILGTAGNVTIAAVQLISDEPAMDLCYEVKGNDVNESCSELTIEGDLDFGEVSVMSSNKKELTLTNNTEDDIYVDGVYAYPLDNAAFSECFNSRPDENREFMIPSGESKKIEICFNPREIKDSYSANVEFPWAIFEDNVITSSSKASIEATGSSIVNKVLIQGNLDNLEIPYEVRDETNSVSITNLSTQDLQITYYDFLELPETDPFVDARLTNEFLENSEIDSGVSPFTNSVNEIIGPNETRFIILPLEPRYVHTHQGSIYFKFSYPGLDFDDEVSYYYLNDNQIEGSTIAYNINAIGPPLESSTNSINFGIVETNSSSYSRTVSINNNTFDPVQYNIELPVAFQLVSGSSNGIIGGPPYGYGTQSFRVTFNPTQAKPYTGLIMITNNYDDSIITIPLSGTGKTPSN